MQVRVTAGAALVSVEQADRLYTAARADRWSLDRAVFRSTLEASVARAFASRTASAADITRYLESLHIEDLALASACAAGRDAAWEHFILEHRPSLYRAADALDPSGAARELADSLYADLYGLQTREGERQSLFRYFHGRSSLATWLRAVLAQRHIDRLRVVQRFESLPDVDPPTSEAPPDPEHVGYVALIHRVLALVVASLADRDRLRLSLYYAQELPLAKVGRVIGESEATVSRQLARTRRAIRDEVERRLAADERLTPAQIARCFECAAQDPGSLDLRGMFQNAGPRKEIDADRSI